MTVLPGQPSCRWSRSKWAFCRRDSAKPSEINLYHLYHEIKRNIWKPNAFRSFSPFCVYSFSGDSSRELQRIDTQRTFLANVHQKAENITKTDLTCGSVPMRRIVKIPTIRTARSEGWHQADRRPLRTIRTNVWSVQTSGRLHELQPEQSGIRV